MHTLSIHAVNRDGTTQDLALLRNVTSDTDEGLKRAIRTATEVLEERGGKLDIVVSQTEVLRARVHQHEYEPNTYSYVAEIIS